MAIVSIGTETPYRFSVRGSGRIQLALDRSFAQQALGYRLIYRDFNWLRTSGQEILERHGLRLNPTFSPYDCMNHFEVKPAKKGTNGYETRTGLLRAIAFKRDQPGFTHFDFLKTLETPLSVQAANPSPLIYKSPLPLEANETQAIVELWQNWMDFVKGKVQ